MAKTVEIMHNFSEASESPMSERISQVQGDGRLSKTYLESRFRVCWRKNLQQIRCVCLVSDAVQRCSSLPCRYSTAIAMVISEAILTRIRV